MKLTDRDRELFKALNASETGKLLCDFFGRLKTDIFHPETLTAENLEARKECSRLLDSLIQRIVMVNEEKKPEKNPYS